MLCLIELKLRQGLPEVSLWNLFGWLVCQSYVKVLFFSLLYLIFPHMICRSAGLWFVFLYPLCLQRSPRNSLQMVQVISGKYKLLFDNGMWGHMWQGLVLAPFLFFLCMLLLDPLMRKHDISYHCFADDTQLYLPLKYHSPQSLHPLIDCFQEIKELVSHNHPKSPLSSFVKLYVKTLE